MCYTWKLSKKFSKEFKNFPQSQQDKILGFIETYEKHGLENFKYYEGKITPSWKGRDILKEDREYARKHCLWHYHIGIPQYIQVHEKYKTSDWVLHFQWPNHGMHIVLVDLYSHYQGSRGSGERKFYLPKEDYI